MLSGNKEKINSDSAPYKLSCLGTTIDKLTECAGLSFFLRYLDNIGMELFISICFGPLRKSRKGMQIEFIFRKVMCFFVDGSSRHINYFDQLKEDEGYASSLESKPDELCSSHSINSFFKSLSYLRHRLFRKLFHKIFL